MPDALTRRTQPFILFSALLTAPARLTHGSVGDARRARRRQRMARAQAEQLQTSGARLLVRRSRRGADARARRSRWASRTTRLCRTRCVACRSTPRCWRRSECSKPTEQRRATGGQTASTTTSERTRQTTRVRAAAPSARLRARCLSQAAHRCPRPGLALLSRKELRNAYDAFTEAIRLSPRKACPCLARLAVPAQR